jgi:CelD/BcsL family acetyltransferase involved in cellulose biosynthesis
MMKMEGINLHLFQKVSSFKKIPFNKITIGPGGKMEGIIHRDFESLKKILPEWEVLRKEFQDVTIFQDLEWIKSWWDYKCKKYEMNPFIIEIKDKNKTIGVIPLYIMNTRLAKIHFRILKPIGSEISDYLIPIVSKNYPTEEVLNFALNILYKEKSSWDRIEWGDIPEYSFFTDFIKNQKIVNPKYIKKNRSDVCPYLPLTRDFDELKNKFNKKFLKDILNKERKLNREGRLDFHKVSTNQEIEPIMNKFFELHCERWAGTDTPSKFRFKEERAQLLQAAKNLFRSQTLYLAYITINNEIVVVHFGMTDGNRSYLYLHAMNVHYRKYSPGSLLAYYLIQDACKEGYEAVDFLRGDEGYKESWATIDNYNVKLEFFNNSLSSSVYRYLIEAYKQKNFNLFIQKIKHNLNLLKKLWPKALSH